MKTVFIGQTKVKQPYEEVVFQLQYTEEEKQDLIRRFKELHPQFADCDLIQVEVPRIKCTKYN